MIVIAARAGLDIGYGHVQRCLRLARALVQRGVPRTEIHLLLVGRSDLQLPSTSFSRKWVGENDLSDELGRLEGVSLVIADLLTFELAGVKTRPVIALDHYAEGANVLININPPADFQPKVPHYRGPRYWLMERPERRICSVREVVDRVLVSCGYSDPDGISVRAVTAARTLFPEAAISCTVGSGTRAPHVSQLREHDAILLRGLSDLRETMLEHDILITVGGNTMMEGIAVGLPTVVAPIEPRNRGLAHRLAAEDLVLVMDDLSIAQHLARISSYSFRQELNENCLAADIFGLEERIFAIPEIRDAIDAEKNR